MPRDAYPSGHFYSPIVDVDSIRSRESEIWPEAPTLLGVDFNDASHQDLLETAFVQYMPDFQYPDFDEPPHYFIKNGQFPFWDGATLFCLLRHFRPSRMIEVGSGFSSLLTAEVNTRYLDSSIDFRCIEPYPRDFLLEGIEGLGGLIVDKVENVPVEVFNDLQAGDVLFVDSSHVAKTGSDVNHIFFKILPVLNSGVYIHFHDVFFPEDYKKEWVLGEARSWNEQYLLQALLMYSYKFEVIFGGNYAAKRFPEKVMSVQNLPFAAGGGSFWMRKL